MVTYQYRCPACGPLDLAQPMGAATQTLPCPHCAGTAVRAYTPPMVRQIPVSAARLLGRQEASGHEPEVVTSVPPARQRVRAPADPRQARLPRP